MQVGTALRDVLATFTATAQAVTQSLATADDVLPPENGIALLDAKNEIFLSYLQTLALRNLNVIRSLKSGANAEAIRPTNDEIAKKLCQYRVYLERGVRPLEGRIRYQVDKVIKAAEDEERVSSQRNKCVRKARTRHDPDDRTRGASEDRTEVAEDSDMSADSDMAYGPGVADITQATPDQSNDSYLTAPKTSGPYRPPRISATLMPTTERKQREEPRQSRSRALDEYISAELSAVPVAEPSIGSTIAAHGRHTKDSRQLAKEAERRNYEEANLVRLPAESKKERAKLMNKSMNAGFGGEEWRGLGESVSRIEDLTRKKGQSTALDRSRKRRMVEDGPRNDGIGAAFDAKKRRLVKRKRA